MATIRWIGGATAVAQIDHVTPANVEIGDVFEITLADDAGNSSVISFTATAATVQDVVEGLKAAADAAKTAGTAPWDDVTVTEDDSKVIIAADTAGVPFYVTTSTTNGGATDDQTLSRAASTANAGPNDWNTAANWSGGAVPGAAASQDVYVEGATIYYGLDQSGISNTLSTLNITRSQVGTNGSTGKAPNYLEVKASEVNINYHYGSGTPTHLAPVNVDTGTIVDAVINVYNSGTNSVATQNGVNIKANDDGAKAYLYKGKIGVCADAGETGEFSDIQVLYVSQISSDVNLVIGQGLTLATLTCGGGQTVCKCALTSANLTSGELTTQESGEVTTAKVYGGTAYFNSSGTITTLEGTGGTIDMARTATSRTITNCKIDPGCTFKHNPDNVTLTNNIEPVSTTGNITYVAS